MHKVGNKIEQIMMLPPHVWTPQCHLQEVHEHEGSPVQHSTTFINRPHDTVSIWTGLRPGWSGVRIPLGGKDFYLLQNVLTVSGAHPASYSVGTGVLSQGSSSRGVNLITYLHSVSRLRVNGAIPPVPLYAYMPWTVTAVFFFEF